jgi:hypothetical protein
MSQAVEEKKEKITEEKEEIKTRRRGICPILSLNSPKGEVFCLEKACEWYDPYDGKCVMFQLKWIASSLQDIAVILEAIQTKGE